MKKTTKIVIGLTIFTLATIVVAWVTETSILFEILLVVFCITAWILTGIIVVQLFKSFWK